MRLVLDTDVIVAGMRSPAGASAALLRAARAGQVVILASVSLMVEYEAVCRLAEHRLAAGLSEDDVGTFLDAIAAMAVPVESHFLWRPQLRDPGDEFVLEASINGRADWIVTFNLRDYGPVPARFGIEVMRPSTALRRIKA